MDRQQISGKIQDSLNSELQMINNFLENFKKFLPTFLKNYNGIEKEFEILNLMKEFLKKCYPYVFLGVSYYTSKKVSLNVVIGENFIKIVIPKDYLEELNAKEFVAIFLGEVLFKMISLKQVLGKIGRIISTLVFTTTGLPGLLYLGKLFVIDEQEKEKYKKTLVKSYVFLLLFALVSVIYVSYFEKKKLKQVVNYLKKFNLQHDFISAYKKVGNLEPFPKNKAKRIIRKIIHFFKLDSQSKVCTSIKMLIPDVKGTDLEVIYKELYKKYC